MDSGEDRRRYFIVGSVVVEVITPLFQQRLERDYTSSGFTSFQDFLNSPPILHILFHLRHRNVYCCTDRPNCTNRTKLPLDHCQWDLLYTQNTGPGHHCYCRYTANNVTVDDLDITLAALLLLNCCNLGYHENPIKILRNFKNNYLSHNKKGKITLNEYNTLWADLKMHVLNLDPSKEDLLSRVENRPMDEPLCQKYYTSLIDFYQKLDEIDGSVQAVNTSVQMMDTTLQRAGNSIQGIDTSIQGVSNSIQRMDTSIQGVSNSIQGMDTSIQGVSNSIQGMGSSLNATLQELLFYAKRGATCECYKKSLNTQGYTSLYRLGQDIFTLQLQYNLTSVPNADRIGLILGGVMMDDGRLMLSLFDQKRLLICNTDGSEEDSIPLQSQPEDVTAVNNSTVAVTLPYSRCIEMYNINNKLKLKSIPGPVGCAGITTINNKLVVGCNGGRLLMIDDQTGGVVHTVHTDCEFPRRLHTTGDRIFYCDHSNNSKNYNLYCYSYTDDKVTTLTLPSRPCSITSLQDGSLYVVCRNGSVQHVSSDGQHYKQVKTKGLESLKYCYTVSYNSNQRKLITVQKGTVKVFHQI